MNKNDIATIALKLLGIYILVQGLASIGTATGMKGVCGFDIWSMYMGPFIYLASGLLLIVKAESISKLTFLSSEDAVEKVDISENFQKGAFRILGIYIAITAIPSLVYIIGQMIQYEFMLESIPDYMKEPPNYIVPLISQSVSLVLGLFLAIGPSSIIKILGRFDQTEKLQL